MANSSTMWSPSEWTTAGQYYGSLLNPAQNSAWNTAQDAATKMASPDYYNNLWKAQSGDLMNQWQTGTKQLAEQAGVGGTRYSSSLGRNIGQLGSNLYSSMYPQFLSQMLGGQQNAIGQLTNLGQGQVGAGLSGAGGLTGIGSLSAELPLQVASAMGSAGAQQSNQQYSQLLPYLSQLLGMGNTSTTYQPSTLTSLLGVLGSMPWSTIFGSSGGFDKTGSIWTGD